MLCSPPATRYSSAMLAARLGSALTGHQHQSNSSPAAAPQAPGAARPLSAWGTHARTASRVACTMRFSPRRSWAAALSGGPSLPFESRLTSSSKLPAPPSTAVGAGGCKACVRCKDDNILAAMPAGEHFVSPPERIPCGRSCSGSLDQQPLKTQPCGSMDVLLYVACWNTAAAPARGHTVEVGEAVTAVGQQELQDLILVCRADDDILVQIRLQGKGRSDPAVHESG